MVETISPVVYGTRTRWVGALALHAAGATATAAGFGALVAASAAALGAPWGRAGALLVGAAAVVYLVRELTGVRIPVPQLRRQVPDWWRTYFGRPVAAFLYGAGLGVGFFTFLGHGTLVVVTVGAAATGRPLLGALVMAPFGLARGLAPIVGARSRRPEDGRTLVDRLSSMSGRVRIGLNALALGAVVAGAAAAAVRSEDGWGAAAAAIVAVTFSWAAISKITGWAWWRRTVGAYALPSSAESVVAWAVPVAETLVPALSLFGHPRAAGAVALLSIAVFTVGLVGLALRDGPHVACGCFGRATVDVRVALARNLAIGVAAAIAWRLAPSDPVLGLPKGGDALPALLVASAVAVAAITSWRSAVWLGRGRV